MSLEKQLSAWVSAGILSPDQAQKIRSFEEANPGRNWLVYSIAGIGVVALVTGILSIVAANWFALSDNIKLSAFFILQLALAWRLYLRIDGEDVVREVLLTVYGLLCLAGIGLISQIYNLEGSGYGAIFLWCLITSPLTLVSKSRLINHLWIFAFGGATLSWMFDEQEGSRYFAGLAVALGVFAAGVFRRPWYSTYFARAARLWSFLGLSAATVFAHLMWNHAELRQDFFYNLQFVWRLWICSLTIPVAVFLSRPKYSTQELMAIFVGVIGFCFYVTNPLLGWIPPSDIGGAICFLALWALIAAAAGMASHKRIFDFATFFIGARFVVFYFELFGSMGATGLGLIGSGVIILSALYLWHKYRRSLLGVFEGRG